VPGEVGVAGGMEGPQAESKQMRRKTVRRRVTVFS